MITYNQAVTVVAVLSVAANFSGVRRYVVALAQKLEAEAKHIDASIDTQAALVQSKIKTDAAAVAKVV